MLMKLFLLAAAGFAMWQILRLAFQAPRDAPGPDLRRATEDALRRAHMQAERRRAEAEAAKAETARGKTAGGDSDMAGRGGRAASAADSAAVEETHRCARCGAFVLADHATACGRPDCPFAAESRPAGEA